MRRARRMTIKAVLETAMELEKRSMALYMLFVKAFRTPADVRRFWFGMARHEAGHYGALMLVESVLDMEPEVTPRRTVWFDPSTVVRLRSLLAAYTREAKSGVPLERAFEMAIDIEGSELEEVVVDLLQVLRDPLWREQAIQLLIHDLGDLSYMVERFTRNSRLLARADELVERRVGHLGGAARRATRAARRAVVRRLGGREPGASGER